MEFLKRHVLAAAVLAACVLMPAKNVPAEGYGFTLCLTTNKTVYAHGDTLEMTVRLANFSDSPVILRFSDAQRYDFTLQRDGEVLWRWSEGRVFAQVLGQEELNPGDTLSYTARAVLKLRPGVYRVTGTITAATPSTASTYIRVGKGGE